MRRWKQATTRLGRVRQWLAYRVFWYDAESCDRCGRAYRDVWWAPNDDWPTVYKRATGEAPLTSEGRDWPNHSGCLCPRCYTEAARSLGLLVTWHPIVTEARGLYSDDWVPLEVGRRRVYGPSR